VAQHERTRLPASLGSQQEAPRLAERDQHDHRFGDLPADPVAVPRDAVAAVAIEVEADGVELHAIALRQRHPHRFEHPGLQRLARCEVPWRRQPRLEHPPVVEEALPLRPVPRADELAEQRVRTGDPRIRVVDPRRGVEPRALHGREGPIEVRSGGAEERGLAGYFEGRGHDLFGSQRRPRSE
jgi:hypothetical protein